MLSRYADAVSKGMTDPPAFWRRDTPETRSPALADTDIVPWKMEGRLWYDPPPTTYWNPLANLLCRGHMRHPTNTARSHRGVMDLSNGTAALQHAGGQSGGRIQVASHGLGAAAGVTRIAFEDAGTGARERKLRPS